MPKTNTKAAQRRSVTWHRRTTYVTHHVLHSTGSLLQKTIKAVHEKIEHTGRHQKRKRDARTAAAAVFYSPQTFDDVLKSCLIVEYAFAFLKVVDDEKSDVDEDVFNISMNALIGDDDDSSFLLLGWHRLVMFILSSSVVVVTEPPATIHSWSRWRGCWDDSLFGDDMIKK